MSLDIFRLDGRVALVTGSSRGLGLAFTGFLGRLGRAVFSASSEDIRKRTGKLG